MVTQKSELSDADRIKKILESLTGDRYILKSRAELVHLDSKSWYLHLPIDAAGHVRAAYEKDGEIIFESPILYEVYQEMENSFSESKYMRLRETLADDVGCLQNRSVREKYRGTIPGVVKFFDKIDRILLEVNQKKESTLSFVNDRGSITLRFVMKAQEVQKNESVIKRNVLALNDALQLIGDWLDEERAIE